MCSSDIFLGLIAILFPPLAVWVKRGICSADSLINILLCTLGFIPGLLHAWYIIAKFPDEYDEYSSLPQGAEEGRVTYVIVQGPNGHQQRVPKNTGGGRVQGYGTTANMAAPVHQGQDGTWGTGNASTAGQQSGVTGGGEGSSGGAVPPTYAEAVKGDHKIQSRD